MKRGSNGGQRIINRFSQGGAPERLDDDIIKEFRLSIRLEGQDFAEAVITPTMIREFMIGFLLIRRLINRLEDVEGLRIENSVVWCGGSRPFEAPRPLPR